MSIQPIHVLVIIASMNIGGAETFIMKVFRNIDREHVMFDFMVNDQAQGSYDEEIRMLGGQIYQGEFKSKNPLKSFYRIYKIVKEKNFHVVLRVSEHPLAFVDLLAAKLGGAKKLMVRSTNTKAGGSLSSLMAALSRPLLNALATVKLTPSTEAGVWLFGEKQMEHKRVMLLKNGMDLGIFCYNKNIREQMRKELRIENCFVIGHVGRFHEQKNHRFIIQIFNEIKKECPSSILFLVGEGEIQKEIEKYVDSLGLSGAVFFLGKRMDIADLMQTMDVFLFPSFYEGMPNAVLEAQAMGLPCVISDTITNEVKVTDLVTMLSLREDAKTWCDCIMAKMGMERRDTKVELEKEGYSIKEVAHYLQQIIEG